MNAREISLIAMLSAMIFVFTIVKFAVPAPTGIIVLYVFRKFKRNAIRALFISNVLQVIFVVFAFFNIYAVSMWAVSVVDDCVISALVTRDSFTFKKFTLFNIGGISVLPFTYLAIMFGWSELMEISSTVIVAGISIVVVSLMMYVVSGIMVLVGFKIVKRVLDRGVIKLEIFDQIIGDSMYEKIDGGGF